MSTRDEAIAAVVHALGGEAIIDPIPAGLAVDALIAEGWRKVPGQDSILRAIWESRVGECNDAEWENVRGRLPVDMYAAAHAILALMDRGQ